MYLPSASGGTLQRTRFLEHASRHDEPAGGSQVLPSSERLSVRPSTETVHVSAVVPHAPQRSSIPARAVRRRGPSAADRSARPAGPSTPRRSPARADARGQSAEEPRPTGCTPRRGRRGAAPHRRRSEERQASPSVVSWPSQGRPVATCVPRPHPAIFGENALRVEARGGTPGQRSQGTSIPRGGRLTRRSVRPSTSPK